jgi:hypothetical protein
LPECERGAGLPPAATFGTMLEARVWVKRSPWPFYRPCQPISRQSRTSAAPWSGCVSTRRSWSSSPEFRPRSPISSACSTSPASTPRAPSACSTPRCCNTAATRTISHDRRQELEAQHRRSCTVRCRRAPVCVERLRAAWETETQSREALTVPRALAMASQRVQAGHRRCRRRRQERTGCPHRPQDQARGCAR